MTAYNTYQEAKIANPGSEIYHINGAIFFSEDVLASDICNPSDYCMTVEKFLDGGNKFVEGDLLLDIFGSFITVGNEYSVVGANNKADSDNKRHILRAAALEEKPKRTKVSYDKWNFECAWHAIKAFEDGEKLYTKRSHKDFVLIDNAPDVLRFLYDLHERIETEIDWKKEATDYFLKTKSLGIDCTIEEALTRSDYRGELLAMCHLVAELTDKPEGE